MLKSKIRKKILKIRKEKNKKNINFPFSKIYKEINKVNSKKKIIGGYYPVNFEINTLDFIKDLEMKGHRTCLPVIKKNNQMDFYYWSTKDILNINKFGIPEPKKKKYWHFRI